MRKHVEERRSSAPEMAVLFHVTSILGRKRVREYAVELGGLDPLSQAYNARLDSARERIASELRAKLKAERVCTLEYGAGRRASGERLKPAIRPKLSRKQARLALRGY
jgi:hypothetical protein